MPFPRFLGALALGLPAAVAAHFLTFGGSHRLGASAHALLMDGMVVALCASVLALCAAFLCFALARREGSIVAARLQRFVPSMLVLSLFATGWLAVIEHVEQAHAIPLGVTGVAVMCVALLLRLAIYGTLRLLAAIALRLQVVRFAATRSARFALVGRSEPLRKRFQLALSRFCRPPPRFA